MPAHSNHRSALLYTALAATVIVFDLVHGSASGTSRVEPELAPAMPTSVDSAARPSPIDKQPPDIVFIGNQDISSEELRGVFNGRLPQSLVDDSGALRQDGLDRGLLQLSAFYWDHGYANIKIGTPELRLSHNEIAIPIDEGPLFTIGTVTFKGEIIGGMPHHYAMIQLHPGAAFSRTVIADDRETLSSYYQDHGYANANVLPLTTVDLPHHRISLVFEITPGKLAYIGRINLRGDSPRLNTLGKTIRRAMKVAAGDRFNAMNLDAARHRIETLGFVRNAVISTRRGGSDRLIDIDVDIDLED